MSQLTVVVADSDWPITRLIRYHLENKDIQVVEVSTGLDCLKVVSQGKADLILLDVDLPDFAGWGVLSLLRLTEPLRGLPVILLSAKPPDPDLRQQFEPDDYIQKPFDIRDLVARVRAMIEAKRSTGSVSAQE